MVRATVDVSTVRAFAVRRLGQLKRSVRANIFDIIGAVALVRVGIGGQLLLTALADSGRQILLVAILLVLDLGHRRRFPDGLALILAITTQFCEEINRKKSRILFFAGVLTVSPKYCSDQSR